MEIVASTVVVSGEDGRTGSVVVDVLTGSTAVGMIGAGTNGGTTAGILLWVEV